MSCNRRGFSLVELLVAIGIIALLMGILLPVLSRARRAAQATACLAHLQQLNDAYQLYLSNNHGQSFYDRKDLTGLTWYELLRPGKGDLARILICPAATEPGNMLGSATTAWGPIRTFSNLSNATVRGIFVGSYGFNAWLYRPRQENGSAPSGTLRPQASQSSQIPVFADCIQEWTRPKDTDTVPANLEQPLPSSDSGIPGPQGTLAYCCIDRHDRAVNVAFLDGHAERVPLAGLWKLKWNSDFTPRDVTLP